MRDDASGYKGQSILFLGQRVKEISWVVIPPFLFFFLRGKVEITLIVVMVKLYDAP